MAEFIEVAQRTEEICSNYTSCTECPLNKNTGCADFWRKHPEEYEKIVMSWEKPLDWTKVEVDTPIWVRASVEEEWFPRHFAKYENGIVYAWNRGTTSWSGLSSHTVPWKYAKLAEE